MGDNLQEKSRKELKELCAQNNIRTAGVKHEELVRLLRNKLYPSPPQTKPRSPRTRETKVQSPVKENGDSYKSPAKSAGKVQSISLNNPPREEVTPFQRKNSGLSRKPLLTKSNTFSSRRAFSPTRTPGVGQDALPRQPSVRRLCQINGLSPLSRRSAKAPGKLESRPSSQSSVQSSGEFKDGLGAQTDSNLKTEEMANPKALEGDPNCIGIDSSDTSVGGSQRVSEFAVVVEPDIGSSFSDADEFQSVSSEPLSRIGSISKRLSLRTESSKASLYTAASGLSFFSANSWGSGDLRSLDNLVASVERKRDLANDIVPGFSDRPEFTVGDGDALESSFLDDDTEVIVDAKDHGVEVYGFNVVGSPITRDFINNNPGSGAESPACSSGASRAKFTSDQDGGEVDTPTRPGSCSREDGTSTILNGKVYSKGHADYAQFIFKDTAGDGEVHDESPEGGASTELESPTSDSCVAKKLEFDSMEKTDLAPLQHDELHEEDKEVDRETNVQNVEEGSTLRMPEAVEVDDFVEHHEVSDLDEATRDNRSSGEAVVSEDAPPAPKTASSNLDHGESNSEHQTVEQESANNSNQEHRSSPAGELGAPTVYGENDDEATPSKKKSELAPDAVEVPVSTTSSRNVESSGAEGQVVVKGDLLLDNIDFSTNETCDKGEDHSTTTAESTGKHSYADTEPLPPPNMNTPSVMPLNDNHSNSSPYNNKTENIASKPDPLTNSGYLAGKQVESDVKFRDGECASSFEPLPDYKKDEREEIIHINLPFPFSIILWCSTRCCRCR
ncbi:uncharacterized protein [Physcomitrium patens]|uniref:Uncharacterized protein n=2 Tax=Physcomitrium patens TaxID=3218 RepID=A0A2K1LA37_PHYPA|nr:uncharacterized protein LOC112280159 isoform X2 [Physcomitrium patens]PNR62883.1 hypothetical protein PHYPA_001307 [Physcomitrium patens]|eukprot:XP_024371098.1 uncharacterized protein LOC112280159 isoform X2 [Physcomitrella patens]